jgi:hypothetical protein
VNVITCVGVTLGVTLGVNVITCVGVTLGVIEVVGVGVIDAEGVTLGDTAGEHSGKGLIGLSITRRSCSNLRETSHKY